MKSSVQKARGRGGSLEQEVVTQPRLLALRERKLLSEKHVTDTQ